MTQDFNLKRAILLTKSIFLINKKIASLTTIVCFVIMLIYSSININFGTNYSFISVFLNLGGLLTARYMFHAYNNSAYINTTCMLPASTNEKFYVLFITSLVLVPIVLCTLCMIAYSLSWILSFTLNSDIGGYTASVFNKNTSLIKSPIFYLSSILLFHSLGCLVDNKKNRNFVISFGFILICGIIIDCTLHYRPELRARFEIYRYAMQYVLTAVFWSVSYINFKKIEL